MYNAGENLRACVRARARAHPSRSFESIGQRVALEIVYSRLDPPGSLMGALSWFSFQHNHPRSPALGGAHGVSHSPMEFSPLSLSLSDKPPTHMNSLSLAVTTGRHRRYNHTEPATSEARVGTHR